jgi:hypothetical protein
MTTSENNQAILRDIFERFDEYYNAGRFDLVDAELELLDPNVMSLSIVIGYLTATLGEKDKLVERSKFFDRAKAMILANEPERLVGLLGGLE